MTSACRTSSDLAGINVIKPFPLWVGSGDETTTRDRAELSTDYTYLKDLRGAGIYSSRGVPDTCRVCLSLSSCKESETPCS